ncbi:Ultraviolet-B receptor UVR8 [Morella rubra]|uniref:Ultraviolet-B receptor UVR8 n=1 Tax=Morella rubra TaxID=262757 RepID=A0A6A1WDD4_9ROSI|nr:Ultraviolet-B receptor UVR8 [Morella rubra]
MWNRSCGWRIFRRLDTKAGIGRGISGRWMSNEASGKRFAAVWGNGDYGRLGLGSLESQWRPAICSAFRDQSLRAISCGGAHTLFLTEPGRVFATGLNDFGQLGISDNMTYTIEPVEVSGIKKEIVQISAGYHHSCAITVDGELYMWGKNSNGQLGLGKRASKVVPLPTKVECLDGITIKMVALGSEHSVAVTVVSPNEVLTYGYANFLEFPCPSGDFKYIVSAIDMPTSNGGKEMKMAIKLSYAAVTTFHFHHPITINIIATDTTRMH